jgi:large subunit ribosomal protein L1
VGKTKTALVETEVAELTGKEAYEKRKAEKAKKEAEKKEKIHIAGLKGGQRIKAVEAEVLPQEAETKEVKKKKAAPKARGKKYKEAKAKVNPAQAYSIKDAVGLVKETSYSSFDGSVELHLVVKKQGLSATVALPYAAGKEKRVEIASEETIKKLKEGKIDFDILLATAEMMPKLVPFARILGPKGLMPNPKNGTLITDVKKAKDFSANALNIKTEKDAPLIHTTVGKVSQRQEELTANIEEVIKALGKSHQILKAYAKATMGPAIKINIA